MNLSNEEKHGYKNVEEIMLYMGGLTGRVLDVGCGTREIYYAVRKSRDYTYIGIDPAVTENGTPPNCFKGVAEELPFPGDHFDRVICWASLDHVDSIDESLSEIHRVLKPDGFFVLGQSIYENWLWRIALSWRDSHEHTFTENLLRRALEENGFEIGFFGYYNFLWERKFPVIVKMKKGA